MWPFSKSWEEKLEAMQSLCGATSSGNPLLGYREGEWYCRIPGNIFNGSGIIVCPCGKGTTPKAAVLSAWKTIKSLKTGQHLITQTYPEKRYVRIIGCFFVDVQNN